MVGNCLEVDSVEQLVAEPADVTDVFGAKPLNPSVGRTDASWTDDGNAASRNETPPTKSRGSRPRRSGADCTISEVVSYELRAKHLLPG